MVVYAQFAIDIVAGVWEVLRMPFDNGLRRPSFVFLIAETGFWVWWLLGGKGYDGSFWRYVGR